MNLERALLLNSKKKIICFLLYVLLIIAFMQLCACGEKKQLSEVDEIQKDSKIEAAVENAGNSDSIIEEEMRKPEESEIVDNPTIVWLGDSLTQGSLGDDGDNYIGAPPVILFSEYGLDVEGFGFYGYTTNDVLWRYTDEDHENQQVDSDKVYIFWLGLNDWVIDGVPNTDTQKVINRLDDFIAYGHIDKYIVMGPTKRYELRETVNSRPMYDIINEAMKDHYKSHYMEALGLGDLDDFGPDQIHLTKEAYEEVAKAVYDRLIADGYIERIDIDNE